MSSHSKTQIRRYRTQFLELLHRYDCKGKCSGKRTVWTPDGKINSATGTQAVDFVGVFLTEQGLKSRSGSIIADWRATRMLGLASDQVVFRSPSSRLNAIFHEIDRLDSTNESIIKVVEQVFSEHPVETLRCAM